MGIVTVPAGVSLCQPSRLAVSTRLSIVGYLLRVSAGRRVKDKLFADSFSQRQGPEPRRFRRAGYRIANGESCMDSILKEPRRSTSRRVVPLSKKNKWCDVAKAGSPDGVAGGRRKQRRPATGHYHRAEERKTSGYAPTLSEHHR
jgi:hypothetical protein